mgnify:FL=1
MKVGELIPLAGTKFKSKSSVPAGKAAKAEFGVLGIEVGIDQPTGDTSRSAFPMPKYKTIPGKKQGA